MKIFSRINDKNRHIYEDRMNWWRDIFGAWTFLLSFVGSLIICRDGFKAFGIAVACAVIAAIIGSFVGYQNAHEEAEAFEADTSRYSEF